MTRRRGPSLSRALETVKVAGFDLKEVVFNSDGSFRLVIGESKVELDAARRNAQINRQLKAIIEGRHGTGKKKADES